MAVMHFSAKVEVLLCEEVVVIAVSNIIENSVRFIMLNVYLFHCCGKNIKTLIWLYFAALQLYGIPVI
jgi:hypothetical protein